MFSVPNLSRAPELMAVCRLLHRAERVALEGIGTRLLHAFDGAPALNALCQMLLLQESGHHRLGIDMLAGFDAEQLLPPAREYAAAGEALLEAAGPVLHRAGIHAGAIDARAGLPEWLSQRTSSKNG